MPPCNPSSPQDAGRPQPKPSDRLTPADRERLTVEAYRAAIARRLAQVRAG